MSDGELTLTGRMFHGLHYSMGPTCVLEIEGNTVIVSSKSEQPWDQAYITRSATSNNLNHRPSLAGIVPAHSALLL